MSSSGIRLRISLVVAISIVIANMYLVLNGTPNEFYAGLSKALAPDTPSANTLTTQTATPGTPSRDSFAAFEARVHYSPNVY